MPNQYEYECWKCNEWHRLGEDITTLEQAKEATAWTGATVKEIELTEFEREL